MKGKDKDDQKKLKEEIIGVSKVGTDSE